LAFLRLSRNIDAVATATAQTIMTHIHSSIPSPIYGELGLDHARDKLSFSKSRGLGPGCAGNGALLSAPWRSYEKSRPGRADLNY